MAAQPLTGGSPVQLTVQLSIWRQDMKLCNVWCICISAKWTWEVHQDIFEDTVLEAEHTNQDMIKYALNWCKDQPFWNNSRLIKIIPKESDMRNSAQRVDPNMNQKQDDIWPKITMCRCTLFSNRDISKWANYNECINGSPPSRLVADRFQRRSAKFVQLHKMSFAIHFAQCRPMHVISVKFLLQWCTPLICSINYVEIPLLWIYVSIVLLVCISRCIVQIS